jgi:hypothetical protein
MEPVDGSRYNSLQVRTNQRAANATYGVAHAFSKALDATDNEERSALTWNWTPMLYRNYALASYGRTHNFQLYGTHILPFGKGQHMLSQGIAATIAGGWQLNAVMSRPSGQPFTVSASATSLNSPGNRQTANQVLPPVSIVGGHGTGEPYFNPNAFAAVTTATFGNSRRDVLRGPGVFDLDASLLPESLGLTNTPQFANPSSTFGTATYDIISSSTRERQIRLALKVMF